MTVRPPRDSSRSFRTRRCLSVLCLRVTTDRGISVSYCKVTSTSAKTRSSPRTLREASTPAARDSSSYQDAEHRPSGGQRAGQMDGSVSVKGGKDFTGWQSLGSEPPRSGQWAPVSGGAPRQQLWRPSKADSQRHTCGGRRHTWTAAGSLPVLGVCVWGGGGVALIAALMP